MSYCRAEGKDKIIFATKEDHSKESSVSLGDAEEPVGLIMPNGDINWGCPCLGGMATGPCGVDFREAFSCFHYSKADPKGSDCYEKFKTMQECMVQFPEVYDKHDKDTEDEELDETESAQDSTAQFSQISESTSTNIQPTDKSIKQS